MLYLQDSPTYWVVNQPKLLSICSNHSFWILERLSPHRLPTRPLIFFSVNVSVYAENFGIFVNWLRNHFYFTESKQNTKEGKRNEKNLIKYPKFY